MLLSEAQMEKAWEQERIDFDLWNQRFQDGMTTRGVALNSVVSLWGHVYEYTLKWTLRVIMLEVLRELGIPPNYNILVCKCTLYPSSERWQQDTATEELIRLLRTPPRSENTSNEQFQMEWPRTIKGLRRT
jgi:hypothetical protein